MVGSDATLVLTLVRADFLRCQRVKGTENEARNDGHSCMSAIHHGTHAECFTCLDAIAYAIDLDQAPIFCFDLPASIVRKIQRPPSPT
jgi:hypothetical protein